MDLIENSLHFPARELFGIDLFQAMVGDPFNGGV